jgi:hypothetical protein
MIVFQSLEEMVAIVPVELFNYILKYHEDAYEDPSDYDIPFIELVGGEVHVIEHIGDLRKFSDSQGFTLLQKPAVYDRACYVANGNFVEILTNTNNAGGDLFFIPIDIAKLVPSVDTSVQMTRERFGDICNDTA